MKSPHLLRVERPVVEFEKVIAAVRQAGARVGWLQWPSAGAPDAASEDRPASAPSPLPADLERAARAGATRAVALGGGRSVAVKPMVGPPVLRDVLREHFRGCALVLVAGPVDAPLLAPDDTGWTVGTGERARRWTTAELVAALGRQQPFDPAAGRHERNQP